MHNVSGNRTTALHYSISRRCNFRSFVHLGNVNISFLKKVYDLFQGCIIKLPRGHAACAARASDEGMREGPSAPAKKAEPCCEFFNRRLCLYGVGFFSAALSALTYDEITYIL